MMILDTARAYLAVRGNGYNHGEAMKTANAVRDLGGMSSVKSMMFSAGGFGGNNGNYWPNTFNKLTDPWEALGGVHGTNLDAFWRNSTAQANLSWIQRTFPEPRIRVMDGSGEGAKEVEGHPFTRLMEEPNEDFVPHQLWQVTLDDFYMTGRGNAYWQVVRDGAGDPVEVWHTPAIEMEPEWPKDGSRFISHYRRTVNGETQAVPKRDVIHFRFGRDPLNARKGWSPVLAAAYEVGNLNEGNVYRQAILANTGVTSHVLSPTNESVAEGMDESSIATLDRLWQSKFTGHGRGGLFIPNFAATLTRAGFSPQEMDIREMIAWDADIVCALFGLNSMILGLPSGEGHRTYANQSDAREAAFESNIIPTQSLLAAILTKLLRQFDPNPRLRVSWDYSAVRVLQDDQSQLFDRLDKAVKTGWMLPSEARAKVNLPPNAEMDKRAMEPPQPPVVPGEPADERADKRAQPETKTWSL